MPVENLQCDEITHCAADQPLVVSDDELQVHACMVEWGS